MKVTSKLLKNGFKVITARDNSNPLVCIQLYIRIGSAWEERSEAGYSHLTEHLVFKSTKVYPKNAKYVEISASIVKIKFKLLTLIAG